MPAPDVIVWQLRHHYFCGACGWSARQSDFDSEPERCPRCGAKPDGSEAWADGHYRSPKEGWTCYHCGETFTHPNAARDHFGLDPGYEPGCVDRLTGEELARRRELIRLSIAEADARAEASRADECRELARLTAARAFALRREEERGYARGLKDERERALRIITRIKSGLTNGGARNACDAIVFDLNDGRDG